MNEWLDYYLYKFGEALRDGDHAYREICGRKIRLLQKLEKTMTDCERINWLERHDGVALISDDAGHWAVVSNGVQNVPMDPPQDINTTFFIKEKDWYKTVREAIDKVVEEE